MGTSFQTFLDVGAVTPTVVGGGSQSPGGINLWAEEAYTEYARAVSLGVVPATLCRCKGKPVTGASYAITYYKFNKSDACGHGVTFVNEIFQNTFGQRSSPL